MNVIDDDDAVGIINDAIEVIDGTSGHATGGRWLEEVTAGVAPHVREWDVEEAWLWGEWPDREAKFPGTSNQDIGIDVVARRRSDGEYIAIQCKARQLDESGRGRDISKGEIDKFISASSNELWQERWLVTNGDNRLGGNASSLRSMQDESKPLKLVNVRKDLGEERENQSDKQYCQHCPPDAMDGDEVELCKSCMQDEAVSESVRILREHERSESGGLPVGQARGKIILPCGTGKTRISLRIVEELTPLGELAVVLCPSIALVAQIRREYLQHSTVPIRALAVCSDKTAGYDAKREDVIDTFNNPTKDNSNVSASEVKGKVTTDSQEIAEWIGDYRGAGSLNVIFGTYQSGHRVAKALQLSGVGARVLIADEAHRTAGLRRKRSKSEKARQEEEQIRDFTLCHDNGAFPATYRVYQTATPKVFGIKNSANTDWIVRTMDDEVVFGVELYRKSYIEAVDNKWLSDYRIIALGVNDPEAYEQANLLASQSELTGRKAMTSAQYLRGLAFALAMGGATQGGKSGDIPIKSCIAFMNRVDKSREMAEKLTTQPVQDWVQEWLHSNANGQTARRYTLEHLDANSNVSARDKAKDRLASATDEAPYGIMNVGIFGEGTDSPSLNAVAFLEARKSPIDVIQAVGRAMRTAPDKELGYIICPILIPPSADAERWLETSDMEEGWQELGQILVAMRAHDQRIEDKLSDLIEVYLPKEPETVGTVVAVVNENSNRIQYRMHEGRPGAAEDAVEKVLTSKSTLSKEFKPLPESMPLESVSGEGGNMLGDRPEEFGSTEPTQIITGKKIDGGGVELRMDSVARTKPRADGMRGDVDIRKSKDRARKMINEGAGVRLEELSKRRERRKRREEAARESGALMLRLSGLDEYGDAIKMNLLAKSGLRKDRVARDLNLLETGISEASYQLRSDDLVDALNRHFGLDNLKAESLQKQADGCTIAALLMMNAAMLHQRISAGRWLTGISDLGAIKNEADVVRMLSREWGRILTHDFRPVIEPALEAIYAIENTGKTSGLERALRHIAAEAERIAETYADMGADHAGPLFNRVMGNQASDGAYFTRPPAASIAAKLTLDAIGDVDWTDPKVWREHKIVDLACGSGTLLAAMLTDMKRLAREQGANEAGISELQRLAVEDTIKGLDINPVSLQLAASQLTTGNQDIRYRRMGLHLMPYGPNRDDPTRISAGSLELLGQKAIIRRFGELDIPDDGIGSRVVWEQGDNAELEDAVDAAKDANIVIMNPPFTNRENMGKKFPNHVQQKLRSRVNSMEEHMVANDLAMNKFVTKRAIRPLFIGLADRCLNRDDGILTTINPTIAMTATSGLNERLLLAQRFHVHTILTSHQPGNVNLSQNAGINESIVILIKRTNDTPSTRFINLDMFPLDDEEAEELHQSIEACTEGTIPGGWGEISYWPAERIEAGDWTAAIWRSPILAEAAMQFANHKDLNSIKSSGLSPHETGRMLRGGSFEPAVAGELGSLPILKSKKADAQIMIQAVPDEFWVNKTAKQTKTENILGKAGHLLVTSGQNINNARLTAVASNDKYVGNGWMPLTGVSQEKAKAIAVFINSSAGRLQLMRNAGRMLLFPSYSVAEVANIRIPDVNDIRIMQILADCWERTKDMVVPQFRDGECEVRELWDKAVAEAMGWDADELTRLRLLLHREPHVSGLGYNQHRDEVGG